MIVLDRPHRRFNPLTGRWVLVSAERTKRPWQGGQEDAARDARPPSDPTCYLCPGNERAGGERNPDYTSTFVFENDFPALHPDVEVAEEAPHPLLRAESQPGTSRVLCFSPRHDLTLAMMPPEQIRPVVDLWAEQVDQLSQTYGWVQLFENRGDAMGASNPHPHGQLWATTRVPHEPATEDARQRQWLDERKIPLLVEYAELEVEQGHRVVVANDHWLVVVPFWAVWPFETLVLPRRPVQHLPDLDEDQRNALASSLKGLLVRYDNLFGVSFPYSMGWHGAPGGGGRDTAHWQLHAHFYPPLLRSATVRKFMVGYEMLADAQRDLNTESVARHLREQPDVHFSASTSEEP